MNQPRLRYLASNESLLAIRHGLAIQEQDVILAIAAAGDQAFAMLEFAAKVVVLDSNPRQILYLKKQIELLENQDYLSFRKPQLLMASDPHLGFEIQLNASSELGLAQREKYFGEARLHKIREKLDQLIVSESPVLEALDDHPFNKAYLSNIIGYSESDFSKNSLLFAGVNKIPVSGLIYVSNGNMDARFMNLMKNLGLEREEQLTGVARSLEPNWKPDIYRRVK